MEKLRAQIINELVESGACSVKELQARVKRDDVENPLVPLRTLQHNLKELVETGLVIPVSNRLYAIPGYEQNQLKTGRQVSIDPKHLNFYLKRGWHFVASISPDSVIIQTNYKHSPHPVSEYELEALHDIRRPRPQRRIQQRGLESKKQGGDDAEVR